MMLGIVMTRLITELIYENGSWDLKLGPEFENNQTVGFDFSNLLRQLGEIAAPNLVVDLSQTPRVDSTGLKFLLSLYQACSTMEIQLILYNPSYHLNRILQIMQLNRLFTIEYDSSDDEEKPK